MKEMNNSRIKTAILVFVVILTLFFAVRTVNEIRESKFIGAGITPQNTITVVGNGEVFAVPDVAVFTFGVTEQADTVSEAQEKATLRANEAIEFLREADIKDKDIQTQNFRISPRYEFRREQIVCITFPCPQPPGRQVLIGYEVSQQIKITLRDIDKAGDILAGLGDLEVDNLFGPNFSLENEDDVVREARKQAIDEAKDKAKELAKDLGVRIVRAVHFSERGPGGISPRFFAEEFALGVGGDAPPSPEILPGENKFVSNVSITYEIR